MTMKYKNYLKTVSERFRARFEEIAAGHNFDYGPEFEIAICKALRLILPERYGVCRGFLLTADGQMAGDDIIIYDRDRFPTLRLIDDPAFAQKEFIPIEAAYAYIEAKHSLVVEGNGNQSIVKAIEQVAKAKTLPKKTITVKDGIDPYLNLPFKARHEDRPNWPLVLNPLFGAIFARLVRVKEGSKPLESAEEIRQLLKDRIYKCNTFPDLIVAGEDVVMFPFVNGTYYSPFFVEGKSNLFMWGKEGLAFAIGICSLLYALDTIRLGKMPWPDLIADAIGLPLSGK